MHPMARGCYKGELNVCKWLYDNGAAEDITNANNRGFTPMYMACNGGHLSVCQSPAPSWRLPEDAKKEPEAGAGKPPASPGAGEKPTTAISSPAEGASVSKPVDICASPVTAPL